MEKNIHCCPYTCIHCRGPNWWIRGLKFGPEQCRNDIYGKKYSLLHIHMYTLSGSTSLSPIRRGFAPSLEITKRVHSTRSASDKVYQLLAQGRWFSLGTPTSSTTKTGHHDIAEILPKFKNSNSLSWSKLVKKRTTIWTRTMYKWYGKNIHCCTYTCIHCPGPNWWIRGLKFGPGCNVQMIWKNIFTVAHTHVYIILVQIGE
jgi:hypothetical protein